MSIITRREESKLTSWYYEIDRKLLLAVLLLIIIGIITLISAGSADAVRQGKPWFFFIRNALLPYSVGIFSLFFFSMMNKKWVLRLSIIGFVLGIFAVLLTHVNGIKVVINNASRWISVLGFIFMPSDLLKPFFIVMTAWFLAKMHKIYGADIFQNKDAWKLNKISWVPYLVVFASCVAMILVQPDFGTTLLYAGVMFVMLFVAGFPKKWIPWCIGAVGFAVSVAALFMPKLAHVRGRMEDIFNIKPRSQIWFSVNAIRNGGLFGKHDEAFVKDNLPEATNDFVYSSIAEDWGAIVACLLVCLLFFVLFRLIDYARTARDEFVVYVLAGASALFGGQIIFNLSTAMHLFFNKGMTLPFVSYGGVSFISFCILFGIVLALVREDTWNN